MPAPRRGGRGARREPLEDAIARAERQAIRAALAATDDNKTRAAELLDISVRTLWYKLDRLGMRQADGRALPHLDRSPPGGLRRAAVHRQRAGRRVVRTGTDTSARLRRPADDAARGVEFGPVARAVPAVALDPTWVPACVQARPYASKELTPVRPTPTTDPSSSWTRATPPMSASAG